VDVQTDVDRLLADPPDVVVLDLGERPDEAIAIAVELRDLPRVFLSSHPHDVDRIRQVLPDARFSDWDGIGTILRTAVERPPDEPVAP
jgi:hypothetical protein